QMLSVYPVIDVALTGKALALSNLILVVRENIVHAAGVNVEVRTKILHRHRAALDMPSRETTPPGALPGHLATLLGCLPEREVFRIVLLLVLALAHTIQHILKLVARELAIGGKPRDIKVDVLASPIGDALCQQTPHNLEHLLHMLRRLWKNVRGQDVQRLLVGVKSLGIELRDLRGGL